MKVTETVVLNMWDGRPTAYIDVADGTPYLHWLILGHVEAFDLWAHVQLDWEAADDLRSGAYGRGVDLAGYVSHCPPSPARLVFAPNEDEYLYAEKLVAGDPDWLNTGLRLILEQISALEDSDPRHGATRDLELQLT